MMLESIVEFGICFLISLTFVYMDSKKPVNHEMEEPPNVDLDFFKRY